MKILTANFVTCAVKACKTAPGSFPLHFRDAELEQADMEYNPAFLRSILGRIEWQALRTTATELGFTTLPAEKPEFNLAGANVDALAQLDTMQADAEAGTATKVDVQDSAMEIHDSAMDVQDSASEQQQQQQQQQQPEQEKILRDLHRLLLETQVVEGKMVCGHCGHEYRIKEGIANFLLPNHLV